MEVYDHNPIIYIVCGKARYGKDTVAEMIRDMYQTKAKKCINLQYSHYIKEYAEKISGWNGNENSKPRDLLQQLGVEIIRKNIDNLFFVKRMCSDIKVYSYFFDVITISDCRAKVEIDTAKQEFEKVVTIRIDRPNYDNGLTEEQKMHFTEVDLDDYNKFDYEITNDDDLKSLEEKVRKIVEKEWLNEKVNR